MATTFSVISLGVQADIDTTEGNTTAESASDLVGLTFGGIGDSLVNDVQTFSPGAVSYTGGTSTAYDMDNGPAETFKINGGADQTFDGTSIYNATITYIDGTTATITAVIFQDTSGNTYLAPEFSANPDQTALQAKAIRSLTLNSLVGNGYSGLTGDRQTTNYVTCFTPGAKLMTPAGPIPVEALSEGNLLSTRDNGAQPIRWIGRSTQVSRDAFVPVRIRAGALGAGLPAVDIMVSQQHRMLLRSRIAERMFGSLEVFVPAKKLVGVPGVDMATDVTEVTYMHVLLDRHEVIYVEDAPTESLMTGPGALRAMGPEALDEIEALFPGLLDKAAVPARQIAKGKAVQSLIDRHCKNDRPLVQGEVEFA